MLPFWLIELLFWAMTAAIAVLAYRVRHRALFCIASLAFLPFVPALFRYALVDSTITLPAGAESIRVFIIATMSFVPVWIGFGAGLLFNWLNAGIPQAASNPTSSRTNPDTEQNWRNVLTTKSEDVEAS